MNAIEWMAARAKVISTEVITVTAEEADSAEEVGTFEIVTEAFGGAIPYHMKKEAFALARKIQNTAETQIKVQGYDKTDVVEFFKTTIKRVAA